eukprot:360128_1
MQYRIATRLINIRKYSTFKLYSTLLYSTDHGSMIRPIKKDSFKTLKQLNSWCLLDKSPYYESSSEDDLLIDDSLFDDYYNNTDEIQNNTYEFIQWIWYRIILYSGFFLLIFQLIHHHFRDFWIGMRKSLIRLIRIMVHVSITLIISILIITCKDSIGIFILIYHGSNILDLLQYLIMLHLIYEIHFISIKINNKYYSRSSENIVSRRKKKKILSLNKQNMCVRNLPPLLALVHVLSRVVKEIFCFRNHCYFILSNLDEICYYGFN